jgi:hypothetical protein
MAAQHLEFHKPLGAIVPFHREFVPDLLDIERSHLEAEHNGLTPVERGGILQKKQSQLLVMAAVAD